MPLNLPKILPNGLIASYWVITGLHYDPSLNIFTVSLDLYADKTARDTSKDVVKQYALPFVMGTGAYTAIMKAGNNALDGTYAFLKTQSDFLTATDI